MSAVTTSECPGTRGRAVGPRHPRVRCRGLRCVPDELCAVAIPRGIALGVVFTSTRDLRRRPCVSQRMRVSGLGPFPKREYRFDGAPADLRQGVLHVKRNLRDHLSVHESVVLQPAQRSGQYLRRDSLKAPLQPPRSATVPRPVRRWPARTTCWPRRPEDRGTGTARSTRPRGASACWEPSNRCCPRLYLQKMDTSHATEDFPGDSTGGGQTEDSLSSRCRASTGWARGPRPRSGPPGRPPSAAAGRGRAGRPGPRRSRRPARR